MSRTYASLVLSHGPGLVEGGVLHEERASGLRYGARGGRVVPTAMAGNPGFPAALTDDLARVERSLFPTHSEEVRSSVATDSPLLRPPQSPHMVGL